MGNILVNKLYSCRLYAIVAAVIFLPTRRLGFMGRLFVILSSYMSINALLAQGGDIIQKIYLWTTGSITCYWCWLILFLSISSRIRYIYLEHSG